MHNIYIAHVDLFGGETQLVPDEFRVTEHQARIPVMITADKQDATLCRCIQTKHNFSEGKKSLYLH